MVGAKVVKMDLSTWILDVNIGFQLLEGRLNLRVADWLSLRKLTISIVKSRAKSDLLVRLLHSSQSTREYPGNSDYIKQ